ncbi:squalene synthase HpnC [Herbaspirillum sp. RTI4]|uniref:squalene synthase HpnC n=1 Tax=Herbaspirillum sp. RTI4 TaxID=3048640 RepID=UPI002AB581AC|nr:squalene synthase HpnC [Herbaspirillum sp. RTI4]MDY7579102.1 squalene synthase HpnC [Herbaspirillum sp. RTI4]MEA9981319.1 squalene synthase HpnC [Herbaspirillum sp. RTI4]
MPVDHYENFPVASVLLPAHLRPAVKAIYAFARTADDIADEGDATPEQRLASLQAYDIELDRIAVGAASSQPLFQALADTIQQYRLPLAPLRALLSAFSQDVSVTRYASYTDLLDYCARSANPVGVLMLHLYGAATEQNLRESDAICSALQLINFVQDVAIDWRKERIYLPGEDLLRFGLTPDDIARGHTDERWRGFMQFQIDRCRTLMLSGAPLALRLPGRIGWELRLVVQGGLRILERITAVDGDIFNQRPQLRLPDWLIIFWRATRMRH